MSSIVVDVYPLTGAPKKTRVFPLLYLRRDLRLDLRLVRDDFPIPFPCYCAINLKNPRVLCYLYWLIFRLLVPLRVRKNASRRVATILDRTFFQTIAIPRAIIEMHFLTFVRVVYRNDDKSTRYGTRSRFRILDLTFRSVLERRIGIINLFIGNERCYRWCTRIYDRSGRVSGNFERRSSPSRRFRYADSPNGYVTVSTRYGGVILRKFRAKMEFARIIFKAERDFARSSCSFLSAMGQKTRLFQIR